MNDELTRKYEEAAASKRDKIAYCVTLIRQGTLDKACVDGVQIYRCGNIVRIDLPLNVD